MFNVRVDQEITVISYSSRDKHKHQIYAKIPHPKPGFRVKAFGGSPSLFLTPLPYLYTWLRVAKIIINKSI